MSHNTFHVALSVKDLFFAIEQYRKILGMDRQRSNPTTLSLSLSILLSFFLSTSGVNWGPLVISVSATSGQVKSSLNWCGLKRKVLPFANSRARLAVTRKQI